MTFLVIFILGAVILGGGSMLSPAWITSQPRIALAGTLALALIIGGAVFWAYLFGWDTLVVDYMLFALVVSIFLGGTLSVGQSRAEKRGEVLLDAEQGWTGPEDLLFFAVIALIFIIPVVVFNVPFGNPLYAYMGVAAKLGGTFDTFAPFEAASYAYPPGFSAISAYLSQQLNISLQTAQAGIGAVVGFLCIWLAYDFGSEVRDKRLGRAMALAMVLGLGVFNAYLRAEFTPLMGVLFALAFLIYAYRYHRDGHLIDLIAAGLLIGATLLAHRSVFFATFGGYYLWLVAGVFSGINIPRQRLIVLAVGVPAVMLIATAPYLIGQRGAANLPEFEQALYATNINSIGDILIYHGAAIWIAAAIGLWLGVRQRSQVVLLAVSLIIVALVGFQLGGGSYLLILPLTFLGGVGLLWLWEQIILARFPLLKQRRLYTLAAIGVGVIVWAGSSALFLVNSEYISQPISPHYRAALEWVKANTSEDEFVVQEGQMVYWIPILSERRGEGLYSNYSRRGQGGIHLEEIDMDYIITRELERWSDEELVFESGEVRVYKLKDNAS